MGDNAASTLPPALQGLLRGFILYREDLMSIIKGTFFTKWA